MSTKYDNTEWYSLARTGGAIVVTIELDPDYGPLGVHPVSVPCKGCFVAGRCREGGSVIMSIGSGRNPALRGTYIPKVWEGGQPVYVPVSDVSQLYFSANDGEHVDIVYLVG